MTHRRLLCKALSAAVASCCLASAAHGDDAGADLRGLDDFVRATMTTVGTPGVAIAVVRGQEVIVTRGYGVREVGHSEPVDADTLFAIGSNTKNFTATALGLLVEEGRLSWDAPLTRYLPQLGFSDPYLFTNLTLRDALSHRTGLERGDISWKITPGVSRPELLAKIETLQPEIPFRSGYLYNNYMYVAAGEVIPAVTGQSWDEFVKERLLDPLGMRRSNTSVAALQQMSNVATPHALKNGRAHAITYYDVAHVAAAGGINSSAADMAQWCKVQLGGGKLADRRIIPESVIKEVRKPHTLRSLSDRGPAATLHHAYALGVDRANFGSGHVAYAHDGSIDGMLSSITFVPSANICAVVLTNAAPGSELRGAITSWILSRLLKLDTADALARFNDRLREAKERQAKIDARHASAHDPSVKATLAPAGYAGIYTHPLYGDLIVAQTGGELWLTWGRKPARRLQHHRADSFEFDLDEVQLNPVPITLSFALDARGEIESVLLEQFAESRFTVRFAKKLTIR